MLVRALGKLTSIGRSASAVDAGPYQYDSVSCPMLYHTFVPATEGQFTYLGACLLIALALRISLSDSSPCSTFLSRRELERLRYWYERRPETTYILDMEFINLSKGKSTVAFTVSICNILGNPLLNATIDYHKVSKATMLAATRPF